MTIAREDIEEGCTRLWALLDTADATVASWEDLRHAVLSANTNFRDVTRIRDIFISVADLRGYETDGLNAMGTVTGVLADASYDIALMRFKVLSEWEDRDPERPPDHLEGLSADARLDLVKKYWETDLPEVDNVVWIRYRRAIVGRFWEKVGQVEFFRADWLASVIDAGDTTSEELPPEIASHREDFQFFLRDADNSGEAAVRVSISSERVSRADAAARSLAECVIVAATGVLGRTGWRRTGSSLHFANGEILQAQFGVPERSADRDWESRGAIDLSNAQDWVPETRRISLTPELEWTLDSLGAIQSSKDIPASARLALAAQTIERIDATSLHLGSWTAFAEQAIMPGWIISETVDDLHDAIYRGASTFRWRSTGSDSADAIRMSIRSSSGSKLGEALKSSSIDLLTRLDARSRDHRELKWRARAFSQSKAAAHIHGLEDQYRHMLARCKRYRNASVHGGPQSGDMMVRCADFTQRLAAIALSRKLAGHLRGGETGPTLTAFRAIDEWRIGEISRGQFTAALGEIPEELRLL
jgi:hypothetical protein